MPRPAAARRIHPESGGPAAGRYAYAGWRAAGQLQRPVGRRCSGRAETKRHARVTNDVLDLGDEVLEDCSEGGVGDNPAEELQFVEEALALERVQLRVSLWL